MQSTFLLGSIARLLIAVQENETARTNTGRVGWGAYAVPAKMFAYKVKKIGKFVAFKPIHVAYVH